MDTSWLSNTSSGVFNYLYTRITGEDDSVRPSSSLDVLSKANVWITDLPTNSYEPLETSHGARRPTKKGKREPELEEKILELKELCSAKNQEITLLKGEVLQLREDERRRESDFTEKMQEKEREITNAKDDILATKRSCLEKESKIEELGRELNLMNDKFAKCRRPDESLCSQVSELKNILVRREEINMKQKQLFRMLAADAQKRLDKTSADTKNLSEELKNLKAENSELIMLNSSLQGQEKELKQQLNESFNKNREQVVYITELETTLVDTDRILKELSADILKKEQQFKSCKEREISFEVTNATLKQQLQELQEKLENGVTNTQSGAERAEIEMALKETSQQISEFTARSAEFKKEVKKTEEIITGRENCKERDKQFDEANSMKGHLEELKEKLDDTANTRTAERTAIDKLLTKEKSQQTVKISRQISARNVELEREIKGKESILTAHENSKKQEIRLIRTTDSSLKHQLKAFQESSDDTTNSRPEKREHVALEQANICQQIVELKDQMTVSDAVVQKVDAEEKKMEALLDNCKEEKEAGEQASSYLNKTTSLDTADVSEMSADVVKTFNADGYFEAKSSLFHFSVNKEVGEESEGPGNVLDNNKGRGYAKNQAPLLITKTNETEFRAERVIPVPVEKGKTKKLKADDFSIKPVNPLISKTALRGQGNHKPFFSMTNVATAQLAHCLPVLRKRHVTNRAEGFSGIGSTVNPYSTSARDRSVPFQALPSPLFPVKNQPVAPEAQPKKDVDCLPQSQAKEEQGFLRTFGEWFGF